MHEVRPQVFFVAETRMVEACPNAVGGVEIGLENYLHEVGGQNWRTDAPSDAEKLIEAGGKLCYRSWEPGLNPNVEKVRQGNAKYIGHVIEVGHGSVIEHASASFIFHNVSRVFTHELVRHRAGTAMSQESMRFVRLDDIPFWIPDADPGLLSEEQKAQEAACFKAAADDAEAAMHELEAIYGLDKPGLPFDVKKKLTSRMRRLVPDGVGTGILWTANIRSIRHLLEMRTAPGAEEEIRLVFGMVGRFAKIRWPNLFADYTEEVVDGQPWFKTERRKV